MPFLGDRLFEFGAERVDRRKSIAPGVGAAGIENRPAVDEIAGVALIRVHRRIEGQARIAANHGESFGLGGECWMRFNLATPSARVHEAVARLRDAFKDLQ